jgi:hypothetical protein
MCIRRRLLLTGAFIALCLSPVAAPASAESAYGPGYAYGPTPGSVYWYPPFDYSHRQQHRRTGSYRNVVPRNCAFDPLTGRWHC